MLRLDRFRTETKHLVLLLLPLCVIYGLAEPMLNAGQLAVSRFRTLSAVDPFLRIASNERLLFGHPSHDSVVHTHKTCFNPVLLARKDEDWELQRVAYGHISLDNDLLVYPVVFRAPACAQVKSEDVVTATHLTIERLPIFIIRLNRWISSASADGTKGCLSLSLLVCNRSEWEHFRSIYYGTPGFKEHVNVNVVLGERRKHYPFNVMRNVALEPWNSALLMDLEWIREPTARNRSQALHEQGLRASLDGVSEKRREVNVRDLAGLIETIPAPPPLSPAYPLDGSLLGYGHVKAKLEEGGDVPDQAGPYPHARPWVMVSDADAIPSMSAEETRQLLANVAPTGIFGTKPPQLRQLFAVPSFEKNGVIPGQRDAFDQFLEAGTGAAAMRWLRRKYDSYEVRTYFCDVWCVSYRGTLPVRQWLGKEGLYATSTPVLEYMAHYEPYFVAKFPLPPFSEAYRGRG